MARTDEQASTAAVFESGYSESLARLRIDARLWFHHSLGDIKIVILISIDRVHKGLLIEK
jgi:hypothetical protein